MAEQHSKLFFAVRRDLTDFTLPSKYDHIHFSVCSVARIAVLLTAM